MKTETIQKLRRIAGVLRERGGADAYMGDDIADALVTEAGEHGLSELEVSLIRGQKVIHAIKEYRSRTGMTLKEAKEAVEAAGDKMGLRNPGGWNFKLDTP